MIQLACNSVKKYYGAQLVLGDVSFEVHDNDRIALVGNNGCGKSTLLKMLAGEEACDGGSISIKKGAALGYLEQLPDYNGGMTVKQVIELSFAELFSMQEELTRLEQMMAEGTDLETTMRRYGHVSEAYECKGGYELGERMAKICSGLKLSDEFLQMEFASLSGGEKTLTGLAKVLLSNPDILLLDEPTNHLDLHMLRWLEDYLTQYKGAVLLVTHDRYFIDAAVTRIVEIDDGKSIDYSGNYSYYIEERERRRSLQTAAYNEQQKKIKAMESAIKQMRAWATQGDNEDMFKRAENMRKRMERMDKVEKPKSDGRKLKFDFEMSERSGKDVLSLNGLQKSFGSSPLFRSLSFDVFFKEHFMLLGRNGCGKTTLLKLLLGKYLREQAEDNKLSETGGVTESLKLRESLLGEMPDSGEIKIGSRLKVGYLPQHVSFPDEELTILDTFRKNFTITENSARGILARFKFTGDIVFKKVKNLSGGEKSRLLLTILMQRDINFLVLDEPTNHLDINSRESLEEALLEFPGTVLAVSHDRYFINRIATRIGELDESGVRTYIGGYDDYAALAASVESGNYA